MERYTRSGRDKNELVKQKTAKEQAVSPLFPPLCNYVPFEIPVNLFLLCLMGFFLGLANEI